MKNILHTILIFVALTILVSCRHMSPVREGFMVYSLEESKNYTDYLLKPLKGHGYMYLRDSVHKYRINDTIILVPKN